MKKAAILILLLTWFSNDIFGHPSWGIVVDNNRNIYFADIGHNGRGTVWKLTKEGKLVSLLKDFHAHNVSLDNNGNLVTAHGENNHTMVILSKNEVIDTLYHTNNFKAFFGGNCTYSPLGEIVFGIDKYIWKINKLGNKEKISEHKFEWNQTVYADNDGNYYAPDIGGGNGKLIKIDSTGKAIVLAKDLISKLERPFDPHADILMGVTKGCDDHIYIAELAGKRIIKILDNQKTETFYTSEGDWFPTGVDFFSGDAYILEYKNKGVNEGPRITKVDEKGIVTEVFNYDTYIKEGFTPAIDSPGGNDKNDWWIFLLAGIGIVYILYRFKRNYLPQLV